MRRRMYMLPLDSGRVFDFRGKTDTFWPPRGSRGERYYGEEWGEGAEADKCLRFLGGEMGGD